VKGPSVGESSADDDVPAMAAATDVRNRTRADDLRQIVQKLKAHAHTSIDGGEFDAAASLIACCEGVSAAIRQLEEWDTADDPMEQRA
jgi:hypothetical protein